MFEFSLNRPRALLFADSWCSGTAIAKFGLWEFQRPSLEQKPPGPGHFKPGGVFFWTISALVCSLRSRSRRDPFIYLSRYLHLLCSRSVSSAYIF